MTTIRRGPGTLLPHHPAPSKGARMATDIDHDDLSAAFWELTEDQITVLRPRGEVRPIAAGQRLFQQGDPTCDFYVVLKGEVELIEPGIDTPRVLGVRRAREIVGELNLL